MLNNFESAPISGASIRVSPVAKGLPLSLTHPAPTINAAAIAIPLPETTSTAEESDATHIPSFKSKREGAEWWFAFGYKVIPMVPGQKRPAVHHYPWADDVTIESIREHWEEYPEHEVGAILEANQLVLDADTPEANEALARLEARFGVSPALVIKTRRGLHHHYALSGDAFAKADSHSTIKHPDRIDVRAGRNSVLLTPSQAKAIERLDVVHRRDLTEVGQDFVDAVFQLNDRQPPRPQPDDGPDTDPKAAPTELTTLSRLVDKIDPDCGYRDWVSVLMAIFHETGGSGEGFELADGWSKRGSSYKSRADVRTRWNSFTQVSNPLTVATLIARAREAGADIAAIMQEEFKPCVTEVVAPEAPTVTAPRTKTSPLMKFSLIGKAADYQDLAQSAKPLLGAVCFSGEATIWYAKHNVGKTLLTLHFVTDAIQCGRIAGNDVFYVNADDSSAGLAEKLGILEELGAHTLVPGQEGFKAEALKGLLLQAAHGGAARGTLVVIDTIKKFADLMNKRESSEFANACRQFVSAGGSVVGLAHVNKIKLDGKSIHAGTTDILDDFDAGYIIDDLPQSGNPGEKIIEFERIKGRAGGAQSAAFAYAAEDGLSYGERLASVRAVDPDDVTSIKRVEQERSDAEVIAIIRAAIADGVNTKLALRDAVASNANISRRAALKVLERYSGTNPIEHRWSFARKKHGAMIYSLISGTDGKGLPLPDPSPS